MLKRLSVFQGGFRRGTAADIAGASLLTLATLVEKSLLQAHPKGPRSGRYQMHELLRQFAREMLEENRQEESATLAQHSAYYLSYVSSRQEMLNGPELQTALEEISEEIDNIRAAWIWASERSNLEAIEQALDGLYSFYEIRSRYHEGVELFASTITHLSQTDSGDRQTRLSYLQRKLQARRGVLCFSMGDFDTANRCLEISLSARGDLGEEAFVRRWLGLVAYQRGNQAVAQAQLDSSLAISQEIDDLGNQAEALLGLCNLIFSYGEFLEGRDIASRALAISRQLGRPDRVARALQRACLGYKLFGWIS